MKASFNHPVLLVVVPLAFAALCPLLGLWRKRQCLYFAAAGSLASCFLAWSLAGRIRAFNPVLYNLGGWVPPWGVQLRVDLPALFAALVITTVFPFALLCSRRAPGGRPGEERLSYYYALILLAESGMLGFVIAGDLFTFFIFAELFSFAAYGLVAARGGASPLVASFRSLLYGIASSVLLLLGVAMLYSVTGALDMRRASIRLLSIESGHVPAAAAALLLLMLSLMVKSAAFPFYRWLPGSVSDSLTPTGLLLCALVPAMGAFGMLRVLGNVYGRLILGEGGGWKAFTTGLGWLAAFAAVFFAVASLLERAPRETVAMLTLSQLSLVLLGVGLFTAKGGASALYGIAATACGCGCLYLSSCCLPGDGGGFTRGAGRSAPLAALCFALGSATVAALPLTVGYTSRKLLVTGCADAHRWGFAVAALLATLICAGCCVRLLYRLLAPPRPETGPGIRAPAEILASAIFAAVASTVIWALAWTVTNELLRSYSSLAGL